MRWNNKYIYEIRKLELQEPSKWPAFMLVAKLVEQWWLGGGGGRLAQKSKKQRLKDPYNSSYHTKAKFSDNFNPKYF